MILFESIPAKALSLLAAVMLVSCPPVGSTSPWRPAWGDEFDGPAGSPPNGLIWTYDLGDGGPSNVGWGNHELQNYSDAPKNVFLDGNGHLVIRALKEASGYTSARIKTRPARSVAYGRIEARIKLPYARGIWPAFWMLGSECRVQPSRWPGCGEVDIVESFGEGNLDRSRVHAALHGPGFSGTGITKAFELPKGQGFASAFHTFGVIWGPDSLTFSVDGRPFMNAKPGSLPPGSLWVFNRAEFFLILNLAVGGTPAPVGYPRETTVFPQDMLVDYVRVYQR